MPLERLSRHFSKHLHLHRRLFVIYVALATKTQTWNQLFPVHWGTQSPFNHCARKQLKLSVIPNLRRGAGALWENVGTGDSRAELRDLPVCPYLLVSVDLHGVIVVLLFGSGETRGEQRRAGSVQDAGTDELLLLSAALPLRHGRVQTLFQSICGGEKKQTSGSAHL